MAGRTMYIRKDVDVNNKDSNASLIIGNKNKTHIEIDANEIQAKKNAKSPSNLYLNWEKGHVKIKDRLYVDGQLHAKNRFYCPDIIVANKWRLKDTGDNWLRIRDKSGRKYYGGIAMGKLYVSGNSTLNGSKNKTVKSKNYGWGDFVKSWYSCPRGTRVIAVRPKIESYQGNGDDTGMNDVQIKCG